MLDVWFIYILTINSLVDSRSILVIRYDVGPELIIISHSRVLNTFGRPRTECCSANYKLKPNNNKLNKEKTKIKAHLFAEDSDILIEGLGGADVPAGDPGVAGGAGRQLALLEDQRQQGEQGVPVDRADGLEGVLVQL